MPEVNRVTQAGIIVIGQSVSPSRVTQAGILVIGARPVPTLSAVALSQDTIRLTMGAASGATAHTLHRSKNGDFVPGPLNQIASYGAAPAGTLDDTGLDTGTEYFYALVATVSGQDFAVYTSATTDGEPPPILSVGSISQTSAILAIQPDPDFYDCQFQIFYMGTKIRDATQTGAGRQWYAFTGGTAGTEYVARARVLYASGWSGWSDEVTFTTLTTPFTGEGWESCPPGQTQFVRNPDGNPWNRIGRGFFRPLPGQPMRGTEAEVIFRWDSPAVNWKFYLSDDLGVTWTLLKWTVPVAGADLDGLTTYRFTFDTTLYADGTDYRLRAVDKAGVVDSWLSLSFPIDNAEDVRWWKATKGDDYAGRWGKIWAETGHQGYARTPTGREIWWRNADHGIAARSGHYRAALLDLQVPECEGADVTLRMYVEGDQGGFWFMQGMMDLEGWLGGISFLVREENGNPVGYTIDLQGVVGWPGGCCDEYLTIPNALAVKWASPRDGVNWATWGSITDPINKLYGKAIRYPPYWDNGIGLPPFEWPLVSWRNGPEPGDDLTHTLQSCARRWEIYTIRCRLEIDSVDKSKVHTKIRLDGPGIAEPAAGYWHMDETDTHLGETWQAGGVGLHSEQIAQDNFVIPLGAPTRGARVFYSWSCLPLVPGPDLLIPPITFEPVNEPEPGQPCSVIVQVYEEDRETVAWEVGDDEFHERPYLCVVGNYGEQEVDVVTGAVTVGQVEVTIVDKAQTLGDQDTGFVTQRLSDGAVGIIHGRRCRVIRYVSPEAGWVVIADGPAGPPRLDDSYAAISWTVRDTRETERKVRAFLKGDTSWLLPMGVEPGFGQYTDENGADAWLVEPATPLVGVYSENPYGVGNVSLAGYWSGPPPLTQTVDNAVVVSDRVESELIADSEELGEPYPVLWTWPKLEVLWRVQGSGDPWNVVQPTDLFQPPRSIAKPAGAGQWWRTLATVYDAETAAGTEVRAAYGLMIKGVGASGTFPSDGQTVEVAIRWADEPTEDFPLHIEGMTSGEFLKMLYDGEYSERHPATGEVMPTGIRYTEDDLLLMGGGITWLTLGAVDTDLVLADGTSLLLLGTSPSAVDVVRFKCTEPVDDLRSWAEKMVYAPTGWFPALDNDGAISPRNQVPPDDYAGLSVVNNAITEPQPDWSAGERIINVLRYEYPRWYVVGIDQPSEKVARHRHAKRRGGSLPADAVDLLERRDVIQEFRSESSITRHTEKKQTYDGSVFSGIGDVYGDPIVGSINNEQGTRLAKLRKLYVFDRYREGAPTVQVPVRRDYTYHLRAGDWVVVDLSWFPDYVTRERGLLMGGQILAIEDVDCEWRILFIEEALPLDIGS